MVTPNLNKQRRAPTREVLSYLSIYQANNNRLCIINTRTHTRTNDGDARTHARTSERTNERDETHADARTTGMFSAATNSRRALRVSEPLEATRTFFWVASFKICFRSFQRKENLGGGLFVVFFYD